MSRKLPSEKPLLTMNAGSDVYVVKYNADGNYVMSGHADRSVKLWNANKGQLIKSYSGVHNREIFDIAIFQDNNKFASCGGDKVFYIWDVLSGKYLRKIIAHQAKINTISLNSHENVIATGSFDNSVKLWDLMSSNFRPIQVLDDFKDSVTKVVFTDDQVIASSVDGILRTYDIRMGKLVRDDIDCKPINIIITILGPINSFDLGEDKKFAVVSTLNSTIKLLDLSIGDTVSEYKGFHKSDQYHSSVKFSKDNSYILQASEDHKIVLYDIVSKSEIFSLRGHNRPVVSLDIHPTQDGRFISGAADGLIYTWGIAN